MEDRIFRMMFFSFLIVLCLAVPVLAKPPVVGEFIEEETSFLRTALLVDEKGKVNRVRRGVLVIVMNDEKSERLLKVFKVCYESY